MIFCLYFGRVVFRQFSQFFVIFDALLGEVNFCSGPFFGAFLRSLNAKRVPLDAEWQQFFRK